jgi:hypothetical protein
MPRLPSLLQSEGAIVSVVPYMVFSYCVRSSSVGLHDSTRGDNVELILNLVWFASVAAAFLTWYRWRAESGQSQGQQLIVLVVVLAILFPVISMTDDVWAAQNPAEPDSGQRRQLLCVVVHGLAPTTMAMPSDPLVPAPTHSKRRAIRSDSKNVSPQLFVDCLLFTRPPPTA